MFVWWLELPVHVSVLLRFTATDCPFGIFKLLLSPASNYKPHVRHPIGRTMFTLVLFVCLMVLHATFNNISVISWRSIILVEETGAPGENRRPVASHWPTLSHNVVHFVLIEIRTSVVLATDCIGSCKSNYHMIMATTVPVDFSIMTLTWIWIWVTIVILHFLGQFIKRSINGLKNCCLIKYVSFKESGF